MKTITLKSLFFIICIIFIALTPLFAQEASLTEEKERKNVLVVNSYHPGYEWSDDIVKGIQSVLGDNNFNIFIEYLDSKRYSDEIYYKYLGEIIRYKYSDAKIDAIIVSDHHAFYLMLRMRKTFHTDVPLIFCGIDRVDPEGIADYKPIYGIEEGDSGIRSTLDLILSIHPGIRKIFFIADQTTSAGVMLSYVRNYEPSYKEIVMFDYLLNMSAGELKVALKNVPQNSVVMWLHFIKDKNGKVFSVTESQTYVANNASVPVYACYGFNADTGILGGSIIRGFTQGEKAAQIARELLSKNIVPAPFYQQSSFTNMFDYKVMKRFNIGIKDIPENSVIYNKPFSVFENYRWQIIGIIIFMVFQTLLISVLIINLKKRKAGEKTLIESESRFRATFEQAAVGISHISLNGRFLRINKKFCDIVGYPKEEMLKLTFQEITNPEDLEADIGQTDKLLSGEINTYTMDKRYIRKDGALVWINLTVSLVRDKQSRPQWFVSVIKDISERKQAEESLIESEEKFRNLMEQSPVSIQIHSPDGKLMQSNAAYAKLYALNKETLKELYEKYNILEDEQARRLGVMPFVEQVFAGKETVFPPYEYNGIDTLKTLDFEKPISRKCWVQTLGFPLKDDSGNITSVVFMSEDITDRKLAENKLKQLHDYTDHLIRTANVMIISLDQEGKVTNFNPAAEKITGYSLPEVQGKSWFELLVPRDRYPEVYQEFDRLRQGGLPKTYENPILTKFGEERYISWTNSEIKQEEEVVGIISFGIDITDHVKAGEKLRESEEKFRKFVEQSPISIQISNPDGSLNEVNPSFLKLWGFSEEDLPELFEKYNVLQDEQARKLGVMPLLERAYKGEEVTLPPIKYDANETLDTLNFPSHSALTRWIQVRIYPIKDQNGELANIVHIEEDITEHKQTEESMIELRSELLHSTRAGTMVELTAALAHELNHPLGSILNNANAAKRFLENEDPDLDEIREIISDIISEDRRASDVMQKLRALMKKTEVDFSSVQINNIIEEVVKFTHSDLVIKNISLSKGLDETLPKVNGDRIQLQQVLLNLVINASDAMKECKIKRIHISTAKHDKDTIIICVKDSGCGIDESKKDSLFKPFVTTKNEGMGMGLSVSKTIIKSHEGNIWAENNKEGGASFFITLPIYTKESS